MTRGPLLSKPCARDGCPNQVQHTEQAKFTERQFCSRRCSTLRLVAAGWRPFNAHVITPEQRRKGGQHAAEARARKAALRSALQIEGLIPLRVREELDRVALGYLQAALGKAWRVGHRQGHCTAMQVQRRERTA